MSTHPPKDKNTNEYYRSTTAICKGAYMSAHQSNIVQFGKPMTADLEDGYIRLSNTLNRAKMKLDVTFRQYKVLDAIIDRTYGFQKKTDRIAASQIAEAIGYDAALTNIYADIRDLVKRNILIREGRKIGPNKQIHEWIFESESDRPQSQKVIVSNHKSDRPQSHLKAVSVPTKTPESDSQQSQKVIVSNHHKRQKTKDKTKDLNTSNCARSSGLDFSAWENLGASMNHIADWRSLRKQIKAPVTQTVITQFTKQFAKAVDDGRSVDACIELILVKAWRGFEYSWMQNHEANRPKTSNFAQPFQPDNSDTSWADGLVIHQPYDGGGYCDD